MEAKMDKFYNFDKKVTRAVFYNSEKMEVIING